MHKPPVDENGLVEPHNCEKINNDHLLIRRIVPSEHVVDDENRNCRRLSTKAIQPSSTVKGGMSIDLHYELTAAKLNPANYVTSPKYVGSIQFSANIPRSNNLFVGCDPIPGNPYHGEVWGSKRPNRFSKSQQKAILNAATWLVEIKGVKIIAA